MYFSSLQVELKLISEQPGRALGTVGNPPGKILLPADNPYFSDSERLLLRVVF